MPNNKKDELYKTKGEFITGSLFMLLLVSIFFIFNFSQKKLFFLQNSKGDGFLVTDYSLSFFVIITAIVSFWLSFKIVKRLDFFSGNQILKTVSFVILLPVIVYGFVYLLLNILLSRFGHLFFVGVFILVLSVFIFSVFKKVFGLKKFKKNIKDIENKGGTIRQEILKVGEVVLQKENNLDGKKRQLFKILGIAAAGVIAPSVINPNSASAGSFGSVPSSSTLSIKDISGSKIDPAIKTPTDGYRISQMEEAATSYYGFINKDGAWYIMKDDGGGNFRYTKGDTDFTTNWGTRTILTYNYFDQIF